MATSLTFAQRPANTLPARVLSVPGWECTRVLERVRTNSPDITLSASWTWLHIDDCPADVRLTQLLFEEVCPEVRLECRPAKRNGELGGAPIKSPDGILLDHILPGQTGLELLRTWRQNEQLMPANVPVFVLAGSLLPEVTADYYRLGVELVLEKAGGLDEFRKILEGLARQWRQLTGRPLKAMAARA